jgi:hypothetical protein
VSKRASLFRVPTAKAETETSAPVAAAPAPTSVAESEAQARKYPVAKTREGRRAATVYLDKEALGSFRRSPLMRRRRSNPFSQKA